MKKPVLILGLVALVATAAVYHVALRLAHMAAQPDGWLTPARVVSPIPTTPTVVAEGPGTPVENDAPTPVTSSEETLPTQSQIDVVDTDPATTTEIVRVPELIPVPVISPADRLGSRLALLIAALQSGLASAPELATATATLARQMDDEALARLLDNVVQIVPGKAGANMDDETTPTWLSRWVTVRKVDQPGEPGIDVDWDALDAVVRHYTTHYALPQGENSL